MFHGDQFIEQGFRFSLGFPTLLDEVSYLGIVRKWPLKALRRGNQGFCDASIKCFGKNVKMGPKIAWRHLWKTPYYSKWFIWETLLGRYLKSSGWEPLLKTCLEVPSSSLHHHTMTSKQTSRLTLEQKSRKFFILYLKCRNAKISDTPRKLSDKFTYNDANFNFPNRRRRTHVKNDPEAMR